MSRERLTVERQPASSQAKHASERERERDRSLLFHSVASLRAGRPALSGRRSARQSKLSPLLSSLPSLLRTPTSPSPSRFLVRSLLLLLAALCIAGTSSTPLFDPYTPHSNACRRHSSHHLEEQTRAAALCRCLKHPTRLSLLLALLPPPPQPHTKLQPLPTGPSQPSRRTTPHLPTAAHCHLPYRLRHRRHPPRRWSALARHRPTRPPTRPPTRCRLPHRPYRPRHCFHLHLRVRRACSSVRHPSRRPSRRSKQCAARASSSRASRRHPPFPSALAESAEEVKAATQARPSICTRLLTSTSNSSNTNSTFRSSTMSLHLSHTSDISFTTRRRRRRRSSRSSRHNHSAHSTHHTPIARQDRYSCHRSRCQLRRRLCRRRPRRLASPALRPTRQRPCRHRALPRRRPRPLFHPR